MKKITVLFGIILFAAFAACTKKSEQKHLKLATVKLPLVDTVACYIADSVQAIAYNRTELFGHHADPITVFFYMDEDKEIRYMYEIPTDLGSEEAYGTVDSPTLSSEYLSVTYPRTGEQKDLGGKHKIVRLTDDLILIFQNRGEAIALMEKLDDWTHAIKD